MPSQHTICMLQQLGLTHKPANLISSALYVVLHLRQSSPRKLPHNSAAGVVCRAAAELAEQVLELTEENVEMVLDEVSRLNITLLLQSPPTPPA